MKRIRTIQVLFFAGVLASIVPRAGFSQYIFLDTNADGVSTTADRLSKDDVSAIDIWIDTSRNRDGSAARYSLEPTKALSMFSYGVILRAVGGTMKWGAYTNLISSMDFEFGTDRSPEYFYTGWLGDTPLPPGKYKLGTLAASATSGSPRVVIASTAPFFPPVYTFIGSLCGGMDGDNTLKFTEDATAVGRASQETPRDWSGSDGLAVPLDAEDGSLVSPNPLNPQGSLSFSTTVSGPANVLVYDIQGRLVRTLLKEKVLRPGKHSVVIDGASREGTRLASGVYFFRIESTAGVKVGRFVILK